MYRGPRPDDHDVGPDFPCGGLRGWLVRAFLVWAWHHTSPIHARVAEASTRKKGASNAASKEDDMNSQRMFTVQKSLRGVCVSSHSAWLKVEGVCLSTTWLMVETSVNPLVDS